VVVGPGRAEAATEDEAEAALRLALQTQGPSDAAAEVARQLGLNRRDLYRRAVAIKGGGCRPRPGPGGATWAPARGAPAGWRKPSRPCGSCSRAIRSWAFA